MHAKRVAVACAVTCAVALSAVPLAAQVPARAHRVGIGISFPDVGLFLPINVSSHVRLEPFVNFKSTRTDYDITPNFDTVWTSYTQVGLGILSVMHPDDRLSLYFGPRGGLLRASYKQNGTGSQSEEKDTGSFIAATVGAEYSPAPRFSVGAEARIEYDHASSLASGSFPGGPNLYSRAWYSAGGLLVRFYL